MTAGGDGQLSFADVPKLELDQLIDQLVDRAAGVKRAQDRLRALLRATELISSDLSLERVLRHIVEAACSLAEARYAALGVIAHDGGGLEQFIHVGVDDQTAAGIGPLPQGKGLLGALIHDPSPIRIKELNTEPRSAGFPPNHPPMTSFLGVPIRVRGEVFGNLYLTESARGEFSAEDEELVTSLAMAAGTAIANARRFHDSRVQQRWLTASVDIAAQLLASTGEDPLRTIARYASDITDADLVCIGMMAPNDEEFVVEIAMGDNADDILGRRFALEGALAGRAVATRAPLLISSPADLGDLVPVMASSLDAGPIMVIPMVGSDRVLGVLNIVRRRGSAAFTANDLGMASGFASQASVALELANARSDQQRVALLEDRDRIARDLHDHVIQQLFAIGLSLQSLAATGTAGEEITSALQDRVEDIDRTIRQIRTSIFALRGPLVGSSAGLRASLLELTRELTAVLGFSPGVTFAGPVDTVVEADLSDDVKACVREGLTNVAKYASARHAYVDISVDSREITVRVSDDGSGIPDNPSYSGIDNLRRRAERRGGSFTVRTPPAGGTELVWKAPIT